MTPTEENAAHREIPDDVAPLAKLYMRIRIVIRRYNEFRSQRDALQAALDLEVSQHAETKAAHIRAMAELSESERKRVILADGNQRSRARDEPVSAEAVPA